ncbi:MAG: hypothetical protein J7L95_01710 [Prolixibacteraceae bacterium]|nr:hypothetical protein [Prolixibacteraceae bacterium]
MTTVKDINSASNVFRVMFCPVVGCKAYFSIQQPWIAAVSPGNPDRTVLAI